MANLLLTNDTNFDVSTGNWYCPTGFARSTTSPHAGAGCLQKTGGTANNQANVAKTITGGGKYRVTFWVKIVSANPATVGIYPHYEVYDGAQQIDTWSGSKLIPVDNTWTEVTFDTEWVPKLDAVSGGEIDTIKVYAYPSAALTSGDIYFDDFSLELLDDTRFDTMLQIPNNYFGMSVSDDPIIRTGATVLSNPNHNTLANLSILTTVTCPDTSTVSGSLLTIIDGVNTVDDISILTKPTGAYSVNMALSDGATVIESAVHTFTREVDNSKPEIYIDEYNRVIVDGAPFFPIGVFMHNVLQTPRNTAITAMAAAGVDTVLYFGALQMATLDPLTDEFMDNCETAGIKVIFSIKDCYDSTTGTKSNSVVGAWCYGIAHNTIRETAVLRYKDHPALLAWGINDELTTDTQIAEITAAYAQVKSLDPNHPCLSISSSKRDLPRMKYDNTAKTRLAADVHGIDCYPTKNARALSTITESMTIAKDGIQTSRPLWMVAEFSGVDISTSAITLVGMEQQLSMAWQYICGGARGVLYYSWDEKTALTGADHSQATQMFNVLNAIRDIAIAPDADLSVTATAGIACVTRIVDGEYWLLACNTTGALINCVFQWDAAIGATRVVQQVPGHSAARQFTVIDQTYITVDIPAYGFGCYRLASGKTKAGSRTAVSTPRSAATHRV